ncbi:fibroblast growth factor receptor homolog 1-like isoform X2 [Rhodnius prolixus]|uniref:fibroblast growth factor receptor homolog 1-like isoform X2 n=1 Tax=Rhodnius prolixus TaxID=13249 RepID=UPI003D1887BF
MVQVQIFLTLLVLGTYLALCSTRDIIIHDNWTEVMTEIGEKVAINCYFNDTEEVAWYKDGKALNLKSTRLKITNQWLRLDGVKTKDEADYGCKTPDNRWHNLTLQTTIKMNPQHNDTEDEDYAEQIDEDEQDSEQESEIKPYFANYESMHDSIAVLKNQNVTIACSTNGKPTPKIVWLKNGELFTHDDCVIVLVHVTKHDIGNYTCVASNPHGSVSHSTNITVYDTEQDLPIITKTPTNATLEIGDTTAFECTVKSSNVTKVTWLKNEPLNIITINTTLIEKFRSQFIESDSEVLLLNDVKIEDQGWYTCLVESSDGMSTASAWLQIDDIYAKFKPKFTRPERMHKIIVKPAGHMLRLKCLSTGNPLPNITWYKNGAAPKRNLGSIRYNKYSMMFEDLVTSDSGNYTCRVCNEYGCIEFTYKLIVQERFPHKPYIREGFPHNRTALVNSTVVLECQLYSDLEPHIQWLKVHTFSNSEVDPPNGTQLKVNAANPEVLTLSNVTYDDEGWYTCVAGNSLGLTYSSAYLSVVDELEENEPINMNYFHMIVAGVFIFIILLVGVFMMSVFRKLKREKLKKLLAIEAERAAALTQWTKKVIIEKQCLVNEQDPLLLPIVKIEKQKTRTSKLDTLTSEYELPLDSDWEFSRSELILGETLGEGAFGKVVRAEATGILQQGITTVVAVKMLKEGHTDAEMMDLVSEMEMMKMIGKHRNIINILATCTQDGPLYVVVEYAPYGNLRDFLRAHRPSSGYEPAIGETLGDRTTLTEKDLVSFAYQVARGMDYLSSRRCIHRDLAARNVLVSDNYVLKIADFGLARDIHSHDYYRKTTDGRLPVKWMAPEALFHRVYTTQSDVWSYGVLLWEIMTLGGTPYPSVPSMEKLFQLLRSGHRMEKPPCCSLEIYMLMRDCWCYQPNERPLFSELVEGLDRILTITANKEYLDLGLPQLDTPPSTDDSSIEENFPYLL